MLRLPLAVACAILCVSCGPVDRPTTVTTAVDDGGSMMKKRPARRVYHSQLAIPGEEVAEHEAPALAAYRAEGQRMLKQAAERNAERQQRSSRTTQIIVVPAQADPGFKLPSEIAKEREAARVAKIAARKAYCEEHPVECETLAAAEATRDAVQLLQFSR